MIISLTLKTLSNLCWYMLVFENSSVVGLWKLQIPPQFYYKKGCSQKYSSHYVEVNKLCSLFNIYTGRLFHDLQSAIQTAKCNILNFVCKVTKGVFHTLSKTKVHFTRWT